MRISQRTAVAASVGVLVAMVVASSAVAATKSGSDEISCDGANYEPIEAFTKSAQGAVTFSSNEAGSSSSTWVMAESTNGNFLSAQAISPGTYKSWKNVKAGSYTWYGKRVGSYDCNGVWAGNGNYTLKWTFAY